VLILGLAFYLSQTCCINIAGQPGLAVTGGLAIAVPLELRGLALAHVRHGSLPWARLVTPVLPYARDGFPAHPYLVAALSSNVTLFKCGCCSCCWSYPGPTIRSQSMMSTVLPVRLQCGLFPCVCYVVTSFQRLRRVCTLCKFMSSFSLASVTQLSEPWIPSSLCCARRRGRVTVIRCETLWLRRP